MVWPMGLVQCLRSSSEVAGESSGHMSKDRAAGDLALCSLAHFKIEQRPTHGWRSVRAGRRGDEKGIASKPPLQGLWPESR